MSTWVHKRGDTSPPITGTLYNAQGAPANLTGATVTLQARGRRDSTLKINRVVAGPGGGALDATGQWQFQFTAEEADTAGVYLFELQVDNALEQTFPTGSYGVLIIVEDLEP